MEKIVRLAGDVAMELRLSRRVPSASARLLACVGAAGAGWPAGEGWERYQQVASPQVRCGMRG